MIRYAFTILLLLTTLCINAQPPSHIQLRWKIGNAETLVYKMQMDDIDPSTSTFYFSGLSNIFSDTTSKDMKEVSDIMEQMDSSFKNYNYRIELTSDDANVIKAQMNASPLKDVTDKADTGKAAQIRQLMRNVNNGLLLRGSVYANGGINSFWVNSGQLNLIAMLFELPIHQVTIGDKWPIDVHLIQNDQNFDCDSAYKVNEVTLVDIKKDKGETIAVLKYNVKEYVHGNYIVPSFIGKKDKSPIVTKMYYYIQGVAEFSVNKGRWLSYDALMGMETMGLMTANVKTKISLIPNEN